MTDDGKKGVKMTLGYVRGKSFPLAIEWVDGMWLGCELAAHWREMKTAAAADGIALILTSGWRSYEEQKSIWIERQDPEVRARKGAAARPGYSLHQSGRAIDIKTGLSLANFQAGNSTPIFDWLRENSTKYGFVRDYKPEPWHHSLVQSDRKART